MRPAVQPTIAELGPDQVVVVGTTGDSTEGGRLVDVERVDNGQITTTSIVIVFKEGEPVGDCSYPVSPGEHLIIAPISEPEGRLSADMGTLQAEVTSRPGRDTSTPAQSLFGAGTVPQSAGAPASNRVADGLVLVVGGVALLATLVTIGIVRRLERSGT